MNISVFLYSDMIFCLNIKGAYINFVDKQGAGRGPPNVNDTAKAYSVNLSNKGEGVNKPQNLVNVSSLWMPSNCFGRRLLLIICI